MKLKSEMASLVQVKPQIGPRGRYWNKSNQQKMLLDHNFTAASTINTKHPDGKASVSAANTACKILETLIFSFLLPPWCNSTVMELTQAWRRGTKLTAESLGSFSF